MLFGKSVIELGVDDIWHVPEFGLEVGYDRLTELYLAWEACLQRALDEEFFHIDKEREAELQRLQYWEVPNPKHADIALDKALNHPGLQYAESTFIMGKLVAINTVLIGFADKDYLD
jgi:hypothetical protein